MDATSALLYSTTTVDDVFLSLTREDLVHWQIVCLHITQFLSALPRRLVQRLLRRKIDRRCAF